MSRKKSLTGVLWSALAGGSTVLLPFGIFVAFARVMTPDEIGLVALCIAALEVLKTLAPQGFYEVLLQTPETEWNKYRAAAGLLLLAAILLTGLFAVGVLWGLPLLQPMGTISPSLLACLGGKIVFDLATVQPQAALARRLDYRRMGTRNLMANLFSGAFGLAWAWKFDPAQGLVAYYVGQSAVVFLLTVAKTKTIARPVIDWSAAREMAREGINASSVRLLAGINNYLDQFALSAVAAPAVIAAFNVARRVEVAIVSVGQSFNSIMFQPGFAVASSDAERAAAMRRAVTIIALICGLPTAVLVATYSIVVPTVFGVQWSEAASTVALLAASGLARTFGGVHGSLLSVTGRNRDLLFYALASAIIGVGASTSLAPISIDMSAAALLAKNLVFLAIAAAMTRKVAPRALSIYVLRGVIPLALATGAALLAAQSLEALYGASDLLAKGLVVGAATVAAVSVGGVALLAVPKVAAKFSR